jgi:histidyl-tRNA synthetase
MSDILAGQTPHWQHIEREIQLVLEQYGYREIRFPILEKTDLFVRSIGESSDIVSKEMYTFEDRNGDSLTLRPEGTASCVRAGLQHSLFQNSVQRLWYMGPMFRRERPQKGRLRQFHQVGVEVFGLAGPDIDAEILMLTARIWKQLGLQDISLEINSLGSATARSKYRNMLVDYFSAHMDQLDADSRQRLDRNPLRILDSKHPEMQPLIAAAPGMNECMDIESTEHFHQLQEILTVAGVPYVVNPRLVRGLDYYSKTVFEWITDRLGAQGTVCAGGRYDGMVEHFGGKPTPAVGFALGLERLLELAGKTDAAEQHPHIYFIVGGADTAGKALQLAEQIRDFHPGIRVLMHCGGGSIKSQFRKADRSGAAIALILGEDEMAKETIAIKPLRQDTVQSEVSWKALPQTLQNSLEL